MFKMNMMFTNHSTMSKLKSTNKRKKKTIKAVRVPIWFSDDSDDE